MTRLRHRIDCGPRVTGPDDAKPRVEITGAEDLWDWLEENHAQDSVWLITWKAAYPKKFVSRDEVLDALVAYGWTDGRRMALDDARTMQLISPRRKPVWARSYKERAQRLIDEGRMRPAGLEAFETARTGPDWNRSDPVDDLVVPTDLEAALEAAQGRHWFETAATSYRRNVLRYIAEAKRPDTRARRIA